MIIKPYRGFGSPSRLYLRGRTLKDKGIVVREDESRFNTFWDNFSRFNSYEIPHISVQVTFRSFQAQIISDREGYFLLDCLEGPELLSHEKWESIRIESASNQLLTLGEIYIPSTQASFGVISDIDDTILKTDISFMGRAIHNTLFKNPFQRKPITGMSAWLQAMNQGDQITNPVFYVSKSPWNIYSYLSQFLDLNGFPKGPILLRDFGRQGTPRDHGAPGHKFEEIKRILDSYPHLSFILIGDIAGDDPMIYAQIQDEYPKRILAVYIRDLNHNRKKKKFQSWLDQKSFPNLKVYRDTLECAVHALERGWINESQFQTIGMEFPRKA